MSTAHALTWLGRKTNICMKHPFSGPDCFVYCRLTSFPSFDDGPLLTFHKSQITFFWVLPGFISTRAVES